MVKSFVGEVLGYHENKPKFLIDKARCLKRTLENLKFGFQLIYTES